MTREKPIAFRPTPEALEALAELVKVHGDRSKAINAALEREGMVQSVVEHRKESKQEGAGSVEVHTLDTAGSTPAPATKPRRSKTNATIAPNPLPADPETERAFAAHKDLHARKRKIMKKALDGVLEPFTDEDGKRNAARANMLRRPVPKPAWKA